LSVAYVGPKSRTERPRKTKIGTEVPDVTRDSDTTFKVKRSKVKVTRPLWLAVLAGQHGHRVSNVSRCVYDVYRVTTCRPGRGHIVAASRSLLEIQIVIFGAEAKKIRCCKAGSSVIVDGCCDESSISQLFPRKYRDLFTSVPYQQLDILQGVVADVEAQLLFDFHCFIASSDVLRAISKLKLG